MSVTSQPDKADEAAYKTRSALDQAQEYAGLVANFAQMTYMHEGGDMEEQYLERLVEDDSLPFDDEYDPTKIEGWVKDHQEKEDILSMYEERIEEYLEEEADTLRETLKKAKQAKSRADAAGELEEDEHRHYTEQDVDPSTIAPELEKAETLVDETDSYTSRVFGEEVKNRPNTLARNSAFNGFSPSEM